MKTLYLVRHAETAWNAKELIQGRCDTSLSPRGLVQTAKTVAYLSGIHFDLILSSPLTRARAVAEPVAAALGCKCCVLQELAEIDFGNWQGHSWKEVYRMNPEAAGIWDQRMPGARSDGGESFEEVRARARIVQRRIETSSHTLCLVVAHGAFNRIFISTLLGLPLTSIDDFPQSNASVSILEAQDGRWRARVIDSTRHLNAPGEMIDQL